MNERVVSKMANFCVVKLSNSPAITCVPRLELDHFELQPDSLRINQRLLKVVAINPAFRVSPWFVISWQKFIEPIEIKPIKYKALNRRYYYEKTFLYQ
jgi:hypothetical protein